MFAVNVGDFKIGQQRGAVVEPGTPVEKWIALMLIMFGDHRHYPGTAAVECVDGRVADVFGAYDDSPVPQF